MSNGIEVRFKYGGMCLICDELALARLGEYIRREASVAEAIGNASEASNLRYISVRPLANESDSHGPRWISLLPVILPSCVSSVVFIVGLVSIIRWSLRLLG
jgi:hypothetical protein